MKCIIMLFVLSQGPAGVLISNNSIVIHSYTFVYIGILCYIHSYKVIKNDRYGMFNFKNDSYLF